MMCSERGLVLLVLVCGLAGTCCGRLHSNFEAARRYENCIATKLSTLGSFNETESLQLRKISLETGIRMFHLNMDPREPSNARTMLRLFVASLTKMAAIDESPKRTEKKQDIVSALESCAVTLSQPLVSELVDEVAQIFSFSEQEKPTLMPSKVTDGSIHLVPLEETEKLPNSLNYGIKSRYKRDLVYYSSLEPRYQSVTVRSRQFISPVESSISETLLKSPNFIKTFNVGLSQQDAASYSRDMVQAGLTGYHNSIINEAMNSITPTVRSLGFVIKPTDYARAISNVITTTLRSRRLQNSANGVKIGRSMVSKLNTLVQNPSSSVPASPPRPAWDTKRRSNTAQSTAAEETQTRPFSLQPQNPSLPAGRNFRNQLPNSNQRTANRMAPMSDSSARNIQNFGQQSVKGYSSSLASTFLQPSYTDVSYPNEGSQPAATNSEPPLGSQSSNPLFISDSSVYDYSSSYAGQDSPTGGKNPTNSREASDNFGSTDYSYENTQKGEPYPNTRDATKSTDYFPDKSSSDDAIVYDSYNPQEPSYGDVYPENKDSSTVPQQAKRPQSENYKPQNSSPFDSYSNDERSYPESFPTDYDKSSTSYDQGEWSSYLGKSSEGEQAPTDEYAFESYDSFPPFTSDEDTSGSEGGGTGDFFSSLQENIGNPEAFADILLGEFSSSVDSLKSPSRQADRNNGDGSGGKQGSPEDSKDLGDSAPPGSSVIADTSRASSRADVEASSTDTLESVEAASDTDAKDSSSTATRNSGLTDKDSAVGRAGAQKSAASGDSDDADGAAAGATDEPKKGTGTPKESDEDSSTKDSGGAVTASPVKSDTAMDAEKTSSPKKGTSPESAVTKTYSKVEDSSDGADSNAASKAPDGDGAGAGKPIEMPVGNTPSASADIASGAPTAADTSTATEAPSSASAKEPGEAATDSASTASGGVGTSGPSVATTAAPGVADTGTTSGDAIDAVGTGSAAGAPDALRGAGSGVPPGATTGAPAVVDGGTPADTASKATSEAAADASVVTDAGNSTEKSDKPGAGGDFSPETPASGGAPDKAGNSGKSAPAEASPSPPSSTDSPGAETPKEGGNEETAAESEKDLTVDFSDVEKILSITSSSISNIRSKKKLSPELCQKVNELSPIVNIPPVENCNDVSTVEYLLRVLNNVAMRTCLA